MNNPELITPNLKNEFPFDADNNTSLMTFDRYKSIENPSSGQYFLKSSSIIPL